MLEVFDKKQNMPKILRKKSRMKTSNIDVKLISYREFVKKSNLPIEGIIDNLYYGSSDHDHKSDDIYLDEESSYADDASDTDDFIVPDDPLYTSILDAIDELRTITKDMNDDRFEIFSSICNKVILKLKLVDEDVELTDREMKFWMQSSMYASVVVKTMAWDQERMDVVMSSPDITSYGCNILGIIGGCEMCKLDPNTHPISFMYNFFVKNTIKK